MAVLQRRNRSKKASGDLSPSKRPAPIPESEASELSEMSEIEQPPATNVVEQPAGSRWASWWRRFWWSWVMVIGILLIVFKTGQIGCLLVTLFVQANMYRELVNLMTKHQKEKQMPNFHLFYYYWFFVTTFFMYGRVLCPHLLAHSFHDVLGFRISSVMRHYSAISFTLYIAGFVAFVISLKKRKLYRYQFTQFAYCHVALLVVVAQSTSLVSNMFAGLFWFVYPAALVVANDCFAYIFGFFFGRTPLIRLSPKKTWEGFWGGALMSLVTALVFARVFAIPGIMTCPTTGFSLDVTCDMPAVFVPAPLSTYPAISRALTAIGAGPQSAVQQLNASPMQFHGLVMGVFASLVAPFGGFFASGFKRAFKIKDFANLIPGHGGFVDRMDCQVFMGMFAMIYHSNFIAGSGGSAGAAAGAASYYIDAVLALPTSQQQVIFEALRDSLVSRGLLQG